MTVNEPQVTKARLIDAAAALFAERGFHGTKVRDIAERARVNLAAANYHFGSKEALYIEVMRAQFATLSALLVARGAARSADELAKAGRDELIALLRARIAAMLELLLGPPVGLHGTLMLREMSDPSAALPVIVEQFITPHKQEMEQLVALLAPELTPADVVNCVYSLVGQVFFFRTHLPALRLMLGRDELPADFIRGAAAHIVEFSLGGIERRAAARRASRPARVPRRAAKARR